MLHVLFICGKNKWRSPTAEQLFADHLGIECQSAGLSNDADNPITTGLVEWADLICVMERAHTSKLSARFKPSLSGKRVVCLDIPDNNQFMDPTLIALLRRKITPFLPSIK